MPGQNTFSNIYNILLSGLPLHFYLLLLNTSQCLCSEIRACNTEHKSLLLLEVIQQFTGRISFNQRLNWGAPQVTVCQSPERGWSPGSSPARAFPELEAVAPQKRPCISACRRPTRPAGTPTPQPPGGTAPGWADGRGGCHSVHRGRRAVPRWDNKGSVETGDTMTRRYPCRRAAQWAAGGRGALVVAASGERWTRARGHSSGAPGKAPPPWGALVETLPSQLAPLMTCCTPGGCRACSGGSSSGIQRGQRCG